MRRVKILITSDGNFHFDDIDEDLFRKLKEEEIPFKNSAVSRNAIIRKVNLQRRLNDSKWWREYLDNMTEWVEDCYKECYLCYLQCGQNRFLGEGLCRVSFEGEYFDLFVHPGIEAGLDN